MPNDILTVAMSRKREMPIIKENCPIMCQTGTSTRDLFMPYGRTSDWRRSNRLIRSGRQSDYQSTDVTATCARKRHKVKKGARCTDGKRTSNKRTTCSTIQSATLCRRWHSQRLPGCRRFTDATSGGLMRRAFSQHYIKPRPTAR